MKKLVWIIVGCGLLAAVLIPVIVNDKAVYNNEVIGSNEVIDKNKHIKTFTRPEDIHISNDTGVASIIDIEGTEIALLNYNSVCKSDYNSLRYNGAALSNIFEKQKVVPIQMENGPCYMYFIDKIDDYFFDGINSHITLVNGRKITGLPLHDYEISGESAYGDIAIPMENLKYVKFNREVQSELVDYSESLKTYLGYADDESKYWPESFTKYNFNITTQSDAKINLNAPIFVYDKHGCDDSWIPCKSYQVWKLSNYFIPVKNGTIIMKIPVSDISLLAIHIKEKEYDKEFYLDIILKNGEQLSNVLLHNGQNGYESDFCATVGILGIIDNGFAFLPLDRIKQLQMITN